MKYGFIFPGGEARLAAELAHEAEVAGWSGFFVPDAPWWHNPWVTLTAVAMRTECMRIGTMLTPVSRRKPWELASETATLDRLSGGRVILSVGLGALDSGFAEFGEETGRKQRAELLDEGLEIVTQLWRGEPIHFEGKHYHIRKTSFPPMPPTLQQPRIPIWVAGAWPGERSMRRVLRYDGLIPNPLDEHGEHRALTPEDVRAMGAYLAAHGRGELDIVVEGSTPLDDPAQARKLLEEWEAAGATWWLESFWSLSGEEAITAMKKRIQRLL
jgi:alkanesulfonate monooxygenase SsuD/methylene tetrahydromethanopterin reductase-like flavin-dependent oxidoreductase (luciferase family)